MECCHHKLVNIHNKLGYCSKIFFYIFFNGQLVPLLNVSKPLTDSLGHGP